MRLIDADELLKTIIEEIPLAENVNIFKDIIDAQQTAYDVNKVVEQLSEIHERFCNSVACGGKSVCEECEEYIMFKKNIEIVKAGGIDG